MTIDLFQQTGVIIQQTLNVIIYQIQSGWISDLLILTQSGLVLYTLFYGYLIWCGKIQEPVLDYVYNAVKFTIIIAFMSNTDGYLTLVGSAVDEFKGFLAGSDNIYGAVDDKLNNFVSLVADIWKKADGVAESLLAIVQIIFCLPLLIGTAGMAIVVLISDVTIKILFAVAPIFIFGLMWSWTKDSFAAWVEAVLGNCFVILFVSVFSTVGFNLAIYVIGIDFDSVFVKPIFIGISGFLVIYAVKYGREMGFQLSKISIEKSLPSHSKSTASSIADEVSKMLKGK